MKKNIYLREKIFLFMKIIRSRQFSRMILHAQTVQGKR